MRGAWDLTRKDLKLLSRDRRQATIGLVVGPGFAKHVDELDVCEILNSCQGLPARPPAHFITEQAMLKLAAG